MSGAGIVYGFHAVRVLLERFPERVRQVWLQKGREDSRTTGIRSLAEGRRVRVGSRSIAELERLAGEGVHQGVVAEIEPAPLPTEDDLDGMVQASGNDVLLLVLDGVQDPHNLGACLRSADSAGAIAVVAPRDRAASLTPAARKVAAGAAETVPFIQVTNLVRTLRHLKELGVWIVGTEGDAGKDLYEADLRGPLAIVMGAEGRGMRRLTREACDFTVRLPMRGVVESLNVSVATGVVLYEVLRQRR